MKVMKLFAIIVPSIFGNHFPFNEITEEYMKKVCCFILVLFMMLGMISLTGCQKHDALKTEKTVMHLSLNPEIEVVLDEEDKVITVNALNEEGNLIISATAFENVEGKTAEEVAALFVQVSKETGYLITGHIGDGENQIQISISGDETLAKKLYDDVKDHVETYLNDEKIQASLTYAAALTEEQLRQALTECAPYIEEAKLNAMEHKELVEQLVACRKETAQMYSQELKNAYYEAKAFALEQAKLEALKENLPAMEQVLFEVLNKAYVSSIDIVEKTRFELLVAEDSLYQRALAELRSNKAEYLRYRNELAAQNPDELTEEMKTRLKNLALALDAAEANLIAQGEEAHRLLDEVKANMNTAYNQVLEVFEEVDMAALADEISQKQTAAMDAFFTEFEAEYRNAQQAAKDNWNQMHNDLQKDNEN
jgi:hypothetical protein